MRPSSIRYYFKEGFTSLLRNRLMTVASIATVAACIFIMSFSYCVVSNLQYVLRQMEDSIGIAVFLNEELTSEDVERISTEIKEIPHVKQVIYTSPDDALKELQPAALQQRTLRSFCGRLPLKPLFFKIFKHASEGHVLHVRLCVAAVDMYPKLPLFAVFKFVFDSNASSPTLVTSDVRRALPKKWQGLFNGILHPGYVGTRGNDNAAVGVNEAGDVAT